MWSIPLYKYSQSFYPGHENVSNCEQEKPSIAYGKERGWKEILSNECLLVPVRAYNFACKQKYMPAVCFPAEIREVFLLSMLWIIFQTQKMKTTLNVIHDYVTNTEHLPRSCLYFRCHREHHCCNKMNSCWADKAFRNTEFMRHLYH